MSRIIFLQPALPSYRLDFFNRLYESYGAGMRVYFSVADLGVLTAMGTRPEWAREIGPILHPTRGMEWQVGALNVQFLRDDIVVVCGAPRTISTLLVLVKARILGIRTIWWGQYWSPTAISWRHSLRMRLSRLANALLFYTDSEVARFFEDGWYHPGPVGALNNGIDLITVRKLREEYVPCKRHRNVLFIGRLTIKAELEVMIRALAEPSLMDVCLHVVGGGVNEIALRTEAISLGVSERITWHGETIDEVRIAQVANRCAIFVYPGAVGLSLVHAMGYGLPCVVHNLKLQHMPEIAAFTENITGVTFETRSSASLSKAIVQLLEAPSIRSSMALNCKRITDVQFNSEAMAQKFKDFVTGCLSSNFGRKN